MKENNTKHLPKYLLVSAQVALVAICIQGLFFGALVLAAKFIH